MYICVYFCDNALSDLHRSPLAFIAKQFLISFQGLFRNLDDRPAGNALECLFTHHPDHTGLDGDFSEVPASGKCLFANPLHIFADDNRLYFLPILKGIVADGSHIDCHTVFLHSGRNHNFCFLFRAFYKSGCGLRSIGGKLVRISVYLKLFANHTGCWLPGVCCPVCGACVVCCGLWVDGCYGFCPDGCCGFDVFTFTNAFCALASASTAVCRTALSFSTAMASSSAATASVKVFQLSAVYSLCA